MGASGVCGAVGGCGVIILDLFCGAGGAARGYADAGFEVIGVDIEHHPDFPYEHYVEDAISSLEGMLDEYNTYDGVPIDAIHASPPCPAYSTMTPDKSKHPMLIGPVRDLMVKTGLPYVIENVEGAKSHMVDPVKLCGSMFPYDSLKVRRHRLFETNFPVHKLRCNHKSQGEVVGVYGNHWDSREFLRPDGTRRGRKAQSLEEGRSAMGVDWMEWRDLKDSIPPAYTRWVGRHIREHLEGAAA